MINLIKKYFVIVILSILSISSLSAKQTISVNTINGIIEVPKNPKKIMVFDFAVLDTIDALGVENIEIGLPLKSLPIVYHNYKSKVVDLGGIKDPNIEKVFTFKPDIIFINGRTAASYKDLSSIAPTIQTHLNYKDYINSSKEFSKVLSQIFDKEELADKKLKVIEKKLEEIKDITNKSKDKTLIVLTNNGKISTYSKGSRFGFIYSNLGLKAVDTNISTSKHGQSINYEYISKMNPDILLYIDRTLIGGGKNLGSHTLDNDLVINTNAGKNKKIIALDSEVWYMLAGGLNAINIQLSEIQKIIYITKKSR